MIQFATIGLSCLLMLGTLGAAPCASLKKEEGEMRFCDTIVYDEDGTNALQATEVIRTDYITKQKSKYDLAIMAPCFTFSPAISSCAPIAGSNVLGFYDRYDENLIPNHTSGRLYGTGYIYGIQDDGVADVTGQLYDYMGTDDNGTTEEEFVNGMIAYCKAKGKSVITVSCMTNGRFDFSKAKIFIEANRPIVFFLSGYNVGYMSEEQNYDSVAYMYSTANHVMVGFGYSVHSYVTTDGNKTDYYFNVASGVDTKPSGVYNINYKTSIRDALAINIY